MKERKLTGNVQKKMQDKKRKRPENSLKIRKK